MTRVNESGCANGMNFSRPPRTTFFTKLRCSSFITPKTRSTLFTPSTLVTAFEISVRRRSCIGHAAIVRRTLSEIEPLASERSSIIPSSVMG